jgi:hypothetical protein
MKVLVSTKTISALKYLALLCVKKDFLILLAEQNSSAIGFFINFAFSSVSSGKLLSCQYSVV